VCVPYIINCFIGAHIIVHNKTFGRIARRFVIFLFITNNMCFPAANETDENNKSPPSVFFRYAYNGIFLPIGTAL